MDGIGDYAHSGTVVIGVSDQVGEDDNDQTTNKYTHILILEEVLKEVGCHMHEHTEQYRQHRTANAKNSHLKPDLYIYLRHLL